MRRNIFILFKFEFYKNKLYSFTLMENKFKKTCFIIIINYVANLNYLSYYVIFAYKFAWIQFYSVLVLFKLLDKARNLLYHIHYL